MALKVLYIHGNSLNPGGTETFMLNYYRHMDPNLIHIDFAVHGGAGYYDEEILNHGSKIFHVAKKSINPIAYELQMRDIYLNNQYSIVHSHVDAMGAWELKLAKRYGVPVRIAHCHSTGHQTKSILKYQLNELARKRINKYANIRLACAGDAGRWLFGNRNFTIIHDAIEVEKFSFNDNVRNKIRLNYNITKEDFVIGNVGRLAPEKNQFFLLEVLELLIKENRHYKLMLVGDGDQRRRLEKVAAEKHLKENVIFVGQVFGASDYYNAFDYFALPSLFEGLGIVLIEAQCNGLHCMSSIRAPKEANVTGNVIYLPLDAQAWADYLSALNFNQLKRENSKQKVIDAGYSIDNEAQKLQSNYLNSCDSNSSLDSCGM